MLLIISPNLCLDRVVVVRGFATGKVHRAELAVELASGKGLNVARAARALGLDVCVAGFIGEGHAGDEILRGARAHSVRLEAVRVPGAVRICTLVIDPGRSETVINEQGPSVDAAAVRALHARIMHELPDAAAVVLAGSLPPGMPTTFYADIIGHAQHVPVVLDATGEALRSGIAVRPYLVKANELELQDAVGQALKSTEDVSRAAQEIRRQTGGRVLITRGQDSALLCTAEGTWEIVPPPVERVNTIGAGDSLTAGLMAAILDGRSALEAARQGIAAAAADVTTLLPGTIDPALVAVLSRQVEARPLVGGTAAEAW